MNPSDTAGPGGPLAGLRIVEFAGIGPGPFAAMLLADFGSYVDMQLQVDALYAQPAAWAERALRNIAGMGHFSVDRTIREYRDRIWPVPARR